MKKEITISKVIKSFWYNNNDGSKTVSNVIGFKNYDEKREFEIRLRKAIEDCLNEVKNLITEEMIICRHENTPTSRLTSLYNKISKIKQ